MVLDSFVIDEIHATRRDLRVALVTETYPPEVNGVAATIARVVDGLRSRDHSVQLVRPRQCASDRGDSGDGRYNEVLMRGLPIPRYPDLKMGLPAKQSLIELWRARRPDVVHIVTEGPLGWSALQAATHLSLPMVSDFRTNFHAYSHHYGVGWLRAPVMAYLRTFHNRTSCTMVPTEALRAELSGAGFKGLQVVARGVDARLFDPARRSDTLRASWGAGPGTTVALSVGRLAPEKNLGVVLDAFEQMRDDDARVGLVLVGDGPEKARLMHSHPHVRFAGVRRGEDLAMHYASADVFLFPSMTETYGNVVPEAMASGLAVVSFDCAAAGQLISHGDNGLLARGGNTSEFCRQARRLAGEMAFTRQLGRHARERALYLDWGRIVDAVVREYENAMPAASTRSRVALTPAVTA